MAYKIEFAEEGFRQRKLYAANLLRFDEIFDKGAAWGLTRKPFLCPKIEGTDMRCMTLGPFYDGKNVRFDVTIYFKLATGVVTILWLAPRAIDM